MWKECTLSRSSKLFLFVSLGCRDREYLFLLKFLLIAYVQRKRTCPTECSPHAIMYYVWFHREREKRVSIGKWYFFKGYYYISIVYHFFFTQNSSTDINKSVACCLPHTYNRSKQNPYVIYSNLYFLNHFIRAW